MNTQKLWAVPCRVQLPHVMGSVSLQRLAGYVLVRHQSAFTLAWDGASAAYIKMSPEFLGWTHGLCGNNNADPQDDLVTSYGEVQGKWPSRGLDGSREEVGWRSGWEGWERSWGSTHGTKDPVGGQGPFLPSVWPLNLHFLVGKRVIKTTPTRVV